MGTVSYYENGDYDRFGEITRSRIMSGNCGNIINLREREGKK